MLSMEAERISSILARRFSNKVTQPYCDYFCTISETCEIRKRGDRCNVGEDQLEMGSQEVKGKTKGLVK